MIWSVIMLFAQDAPRLWAFLPNGTGAFPHRDEQFCSSLWAEMLIMMGCLFVHMVDSLKCK